MEKAKNTFSSKQIGWKLKHTFRARIPAGGYKLKTEVLSKTRSAEGCAKMPKDIEIITKHTNNFFMGLDFIKDTKSIRLELK